MEFDESRVYLPGDDPRNMDWRVTARAGTPHVKLFREERERPVWLLVDQGPSMRFGTRVAFKSVVAARVAALLGWAAVDRGDRVGGLVFDESRHLERRPAARGRVCCRCSNVWPRRWRWGRAVMPDSLRRLRIWRRSCVREA
jgi:uncharacterized protein (DUF58 family)